MICTPVEVATIVEAGHTVYVQKDAGAGAGFSNEVYEKAGAIRADSAALMREKCDFLAKVKEIEASEYAYLREGQMIYCCIHPAGHPQEVQAIQNRLWIPPEDVLKIADRQLGPAAITSINKV